MVQELLCYNLLLDYWRLPRERRVGALKGVPSSALSCLARVESLSPIRPHRVLAKLSPLQKQLPEKALQQLAVRDIYVSSYSAGYVPACWRQSKVVFIPKPGKKDYSKAKSFRPITLTPFLSKQWRKSFSGTWSPKVFTKN